VSATVNFGPGPPAPFAQTVTADANKTTFRWASTAAFREVRGTFVSSASLGSYAVNATTAGTANTFSDASIPAAGTGYWYLVKAGGCAATSCNRRLARRPAGTRPSPDLGSSHGHAPDEFAMRTPAVAAPNGPSSIPFEPTTRYQ
jgi:hypothetical protein